MKINDEITVEIEKVTNCGEGLARFSENNFVIFVKNALPNEKVKVKIVSLNKHFAKGEIIEILTPSKERIRPFCALYNACGSCNLQNCNYDYTIVLKAEIIKEMFDKHKENILPFIKSPETLCYRHKVQFPARETKKSKRVLLGYFKENSHDLTNIKFCPIQDTIINDIAQFIRDNYTLGCFNEKNQKGLLKNVLMRINSDKNSILLTLVLNATEKEFENKLENSIFRFSKKVSNKFKEIKGIFVNFNPKNTNKILGNETLKVLGEDFILEKLGNKIYKIGPESFFQVNVKSAEKLFNVIKENIEENSSILDAYGGVGAIGIFISDKVSSITLVEENKNAIKMAKENFELNNIKNFEILEGNAENHFVNFKNENRTFDYVILDPPRSGVEEKALENIISCAKNIIYVSCNPVTLKRDMEKILNNGFKIDFIQGADFFPFTYHIETVTIFKKG